MKRLLSLFLTISVSITLIPTVYAADTGITQNPNVVSVGDSHTAVIKNDGTLWMWGNNEYGQLGNGTTESSFVPIKILDNINAVSCSEVNARTAAIKNDGTLWMWGNNGNGELGNDSTTSSYVPIKVLDNVSAVSCDWLHTAAVKRDGTLWMWGSNADGQLGIGSTWRSTIPVKVLDNVKSVSCGSYHTAAIKTDGTLWSWGAGWLGNGTSEGSSIPTKILDGVSSVSCGNQHSAIIKTDGSLWTWGANWWGELGDGTTEDSKVPIKILENVSLVSCRGHLAAVKKDGSLWTWGMNSHGQLGNGGDGNGISAGGCAIQTFPIKVMNNVKIVNTNLILLSKPSSWAESEVNSAKNAGLVTDSVTEDYQANITREQFCEMVVKLYEKITGKKAKRGYISFDDTYNDEILKAANLGIVNGYSEDTFAPHDYITREQIAAMLVRAIGIAYANVDLRDYIYRTFSDSYNISDWAMDSVQFAVDNYIMQGVGDNKIDPLGNTTCEQAILLINRVYKNRKNFENKNIVEIIEELKKLEFDEDEAVNSVTVKYSDGSDASGVKIKEIKKSDLIYQTTGMKGAGVNITSSDDFDKATITFEYNAEQLNGSNPSDLAVAWYNTDLDRIEVLESQVDTYNHTVSVETTHFSQYILVDSKEWYSIWQRGQTIIRETNNDGDYADNFNVQLVVDCSGSMSGDRIVTARECTYDFIQKLSANDKFSLIQFEDDATTTIPSTLVKDADMDSVKNIVMSMRDGGGTEFNAALNECIRTLDFDDDYNNIIVFLSDGDSSVDDSILQILRNNNVRIASVALGSGSNTSMMKKLSDSTNGQYVYAEDSSDLDAIYSAIQGSLIGVDATDTDGDGIPDMIEITGMKNQYGKIIRTDPNKYDTDSDGKSDGEEMGKLIESDELTDMDKKNGITSNVYFEMKSNPLDGVDEEDISDEVISIDPFVTLSATRTEMDENGKFKLSIDIDVSGGKAENISLKLSSDSCVNKVWIFDVEANGNENYPKESSKVSGDYWENTITNMGDFNEGHHTEIYDMYCSEIKNNAVCGKSHIINVEISGDNFKPVQLRVMPPEKVDTPIVIPQPEKKYQYTKEELDSKDNYFEIDGDCYCYADDVDIKCDLKFKYGSSLNFSGNVTVESKGLLDMSQGGTLIVNGDFKFDSSESHLGKLNLGTIEIYGNAEFVKNFYATQSNKVIFKGSGRHEINMWNKLGESNDQYFQDIDVEGDIFDITLKEKDVKANGKINFTDWNWLNQLFVGNDIELAKDATLKLSPIEEQLLKLSVMRAYVQFGERTNIWGDIEYLHVNKDFVEYTYLVKDGAKKYKEITISLNNITCTGMQAGKSTVIITALYNGKLCTFYTSPEFSEEAFKYFKQEIKKGIVLEIADSFVDEYKSLVSGCISEFLPQDINDAAEMLGFISDYKDMLEAYSELNN